MDKLLGALLLSLSVVGGTSVINSTCNVVDKTVHEFTARMLNRTDGMSLGKYKGKVLLIVNVATF